MMTKALHKGSIILRRSAAVNLLQTHAICYITVVKVFAEENAVLVHLPLQNLVVIV